jgi:BirA family transcriptional regulator, biotin operon repressor / biotin---[acetyl-CoA-carboxylase] ligase
LAAKLRHLFQSLLKDSHIGAQYLFLDSIDSTNTYCRTMLNGDVQPPEGLVVQAGKQTNGKGQMGNVWHTEEGKNLTFSCIVYPRFLAPTEQFQLNIAVSLALISVLDEYVDAVSIKWPNDIYVGNKKIAGILIENSLMGNKIQSSIIGIGLNINQNSFVGLQATSLYMQSGVEYSLTHILQQWCVIFNNYYTLLKARSFAGIKQKYLQRMWGYNKKVQYYLNNELQNGVILGVNALGQLMMEENNQTVLYNFKEIRFVI